MLLGQIGLLIPFAQRKKQQLRRITVPADSATTVQRSTKDLLQGCPVAGGQRTQDSARAAQLRMGGVPIHS